RRGRARLLEVRDALLEAALDHRELAREVDLLVLALEDLRLLLLLQDAQRRCAVDPGAPQDEGREEAEAERDGQHDEPARPLPESLLDLLLRQLVLGGRHRVSPLVGWRLHSARACSDELDTAPCNTQVSGVW